MVSRRDLVERGRGHQAELGIVVEAVRVRRHCERGFERGGSVEGLVRRKPNGEPWSMRTTQMTGDSGRGIGWEKKTEVVCCAELQYLSCRAPGRPENPRDRPASILALHEEEDDRVTLVSVS